MLQPGVAHRRDDGGRNGPGIAGEQGRRDRALRTRQGRAHLPLDGFAHGRQPVGEAAGRRAAGDGLRRRQRIADGSQPLEPGGPGIVEARRLAGSRRWVQDRPQADPFADAQGACGPCRFTPPRHPHHGRRALPGQALNAEILQYQALAARIAPQIGQPPLQQPGPLALGDHRGRDLAGAPLRRGEAEQDERHQQADRMATRP